jgi:hypothetical protein
MRGLLDTSIFVAREQERPHGQLPDEGAISVMTLAELHLGVLMARSGKVRAQRLRTLAQVERTFDALPVDEDVARMFAQVVSEARRMGRRPKIVDALIAATAIVQGLPVFSQDDDFRQIPGAEVVVI